MATGLWSCPQITIARTAPAAAFNPQKHITIKKIEPDAAREEVKIFFSQPVPLEVLQAYLRLLPRIKLDWNRSRVSPDGVLTLRGNFKYGAGHVITLKDGAVVQGRTYFPTVTTFRMPNRPAKVEFVGHKRVIERDSQQLLHVRVANVTNLNLEQVRVPPLLLPQALAAEKAGSDLQETMEQLRTAAAELNPLVQGKSAYAPFVGTALEEKELFPAREEENRLLAVSLPLSFRQDKKAGALELIRVRDNQEGSRAAAGPRLFRVTDLGLTYKTGGKSLLLWVTSLKGGGPVAGVQVLAFTRQTEVFPLGQTDKDGILTFSPRELEGFSLKQLGSFKPMKRRVEKGDLTFLLVGKAGDVSYIEVKPQGNLKPKDVWHVGRSEQPQNLKGVVFTERGVYRPGEKVFFKGTVREYQKGAILPPQSKKCVFEVTNPRGEQVFVKKVELSEFGTAAGEMTTQPHWAMGTYTMTMNFGPDAKPSAKPKKRSDFDESEKRKGRNKAPLHKTSTTFQVQEFKPPRHFTDIAFERFTREDKTFVNRERQAEFVKIVISGSYYAGGPVKRGQVRWRIHQAPTSYQVPGFDTFTFGYPAREKGVLIESGQANLDQQGKTVVEFPLDRCLLAGRQGLSVVATVVDFDGRAAAASKAFQVKPDFMVGISRHPKSFQMGESNKLKVVVVDKQGKKVGQGSLQAEVLQRSWSYVAKRNERGDVYWDDEATWRKAFSRDLPLKEGQAPFRFDSAQPGRYLLAFTFTDAQGRRFSSASFVRVDWEYIPEEKRDRPYQTLGLWADRPVYKPGATANIHISPKGPVSYYLVTLEREGLLTHQVVPGGKGPKTLPLLMKAEYGPNVYVSVLGLNPRGDFPVRPGRYDLEAPGFVWGNLNLPVLKEPEGLEVKINPEVAKWRARPGDKVTVDLTVATPKGQGLEAELALAVVDEAVLALTGYKTPTLEKLTRFNLPLAVFTGELRTLLVHQTPFYPSRVEPLTGGGGLSADIVAKLRRRFQAVVYFNPRVKTDAQGKARVSFTLPDNITSYRVFAVALDRGSRFASVQRQLIATKDFYLEPGLPGFFTRGDRFKFQVSATNATGDKGSVKFRAAAEGGLNLEAVDTTGQLNPKDSLKLAVAGEANAAGKAKATFAGEFQDNKDEVELSLKINSGYVRQKASVLGDFSGAKTVKIPLPSYLTGAAAKVNPEEIQAVLTLSGSPFLRFTRPIKYLLTYPYGCVEQISSGVLGLSALRGLIREKLITDIKPNKVDNFLRSGIGRLMNMQTQQGGFSYWPGQRYSHPFGTLYALAALSIAKTQGLAVPEVGFKKGIKHLAYKVRYGKSTPLEKAFACYVLALNKALPPALYQKVMREYPSLTREGKLFLILAAQQARLRSLRMLMAYLKPILEGKDRDKVRDEIVEEGFDARFRGPALALLAAKAIMPEDRLTRQAALYLLGGLGRQGIWTSTSDTGWALLALGEYYKGATFRKQPGKVTVSQPGRPAQELSWNPGGSASISLDAKALLKNPVVKLKGKARTWLYQVDLTYPRLDLKEKGEDRGFKVTKTIKNTDGKKLIRVGDLVKVTLNVDIQGLARRYVVLDDPLPGGLVALNTALKTEEPTPKKEDDHFDYLTSDGVIRFFPNHFEIRGDRVLAFRDQVYPGTFRFEYYARAVCEGDFVMPPTQAAAMYNPGVQGFSPPGRLTIKAIKGR
jgi:uncharacterized protein YfaS (alpha-2-macroglobulin family)